jgi:prepilin-type N-terminal cleavage/methylation domain-containing protein
MNGVRHDGGFSLIELLVAIALSLVILGAVVSFFTAYNRQSTATNQRSAAQDKARLAIDRVVRQLRNIASPLSTPKLLERATPYDIVFQTIGAPSGANTAGVERVRYCIPPDPNGTPSAEELYGETQTWSTGPGSPAADPWSSDPTVTIACPDVPVGTTQTCPGGSGTCTAAIVADGIVNRYQGSSRPAFTFVTGTPPNASSSTTPSIGTLAQISSVQIDLFVNPTPSLPAAQTELKSSAFVRNQQLAPVASFTYNAIGSGTVVLDGGTSYSPDGDDLSFQWACTSPSPCPASATLAAASDGLISWSPGPGTYTVQLTVTDSTGLSTATSQTVTVS